MASFSAGTTFTDGVANDVTAAKLGALVNNATPTSGLIQDRTAETVTATNDTLLIGDASDSNNLKRITVANFAQTLPTAKITTGTIETGTFGTTTSTAATITLVTTGTGTAASPAIVPTGDTNTGIFFPAADTIAFSEGGTESMRIDSSGNVGIGTASPSSILHISKTGAAFPSSSNPRIRLDEVSSGRFGIIEFDSSTNLNIWGSDAGSGSIRFFNGTGSGTERLRIDSSGNVGIGVTSPAVKLDVSNGNIQGKEIFLQNGAASSPALGTTPSWYSPASGVAALSTNAFERLRIDSSGNVGINTSSPDALLDVKRTNSDGLIAEMGSGDLAGDVVLEIKSADSRASINIGATGGTGDASRNLAFSTSGTERLRIDSGGNVGIGTTSPSGRLSVSSGSAAQYASFNSNAANGGYLTIESSGTVHGDIGTAAQVVSGGSTSDFGINARGSRNLVLGTNNTERLRIDSSGFVSIGTATGLSALHVHGNVTLSNTTTATSAGTGGLSKPATYAGYLTVSINGTSRKIPYYAT